MWPRREGQRGVWLLNKAVYKIIHQISLLMRDWSKHLTWPNILQLKLGNIRDYNPSNLSFACDWSKHVTWPIIPQLKLGDIWEYTPIFKTAHVTTKIWRIINMIVSIWGKNMLGYLSLDIICSLKQTGFWECSSRKTVSFEKQIMSMDKYPTPIKLALNPWATS